MTTVQELGKPVGDQPLSDSRLPAWTRREPYPAGKKLLASVTLAQPHWSQFWTESAGITARILIWTGSLKSQSSSPDGAVAAVFVDCFVKLKFFCRALS